MSCSCEPQLLLFYAAGLLGTREQREIEMHLQEGCAPCAQALADAEDLLADLMLAIEPVPPPARLKREVQVRCGV